MDIFQFLNPLCVSWSGLGWCRSLGRSLRGGAEAEGEDEKRDGKNAHGAVFEWKLRNGKLRSQGNRSTWAETRSREREDAQ